MEMFTIIIGQQIMEYYTTWFAQFMSDIEQTIYGRQLPIWLCTNERFIYQITIQFYYYTLLKMQYTVGPGELYLNKIAHHVDKVQSSRCIGRVIFWNRFNQRQSDIDIDLTKLQDITKM